MARDDDLFARSTSPTARHQRLYHHHRAAEFKKFLARIDENVPAGLEVHLVCDNLATHKTPLIQEWLARHPRFRLHFTTDRLVLDQPGRAVVRLPDRQMIRRGVHMSVQPLEAYIRAWIENWNQNPRPFAWTKTADEICDSLAKELSRFHPSPPSRISGCADCSSALPRHRMGPCISISGGSAPRRHGTGFGGRPLRLGGACIPAEALNCSDAEIRSVGEAI